MFYINRFSLVTTGFNRSIFFQKIFDVKRYIKGLKCWIVNCYLYLKWEKCCFALKIFSFLYFIRILKLQNLWCLHHRPYYYYFYFIRTEKKFTWSHILQWKIDYLHYRHCDKTFLYVFNPNVEALATSSTPFYNFDKMTV